MAHHTTLIVLSTMTLLLATPGALALGAAGIEVDAQAEVNAAVDATGAFDQVDALKEKADSTVSDAKATAQEKAEEAKGEAQNAAQRAIGALHDAFSSLSQAAAGLAARVHVSASIDGIFHL